MAFKM